MNADPIITALAESTGTIGSVAYAYANRAEADLGGQWIDSWFRNGCNEHRAAELVKELDVGTIPANLLQKLEASYTATSDTRRLLRVRVHYFRGFRAATDWVDTSAGLTVIDGSNSAGKTSLAEAVEWLFSGQLIRRSLRDLGNSRELEACIANVFRPASETTWVESVLECVDGTTMAVRRELLRDYGSASTEKCLSKFFLDGKELTAVEEQELFRRCFAGEPPILMQHTLRLFVYSAPSDRRKYFEQLLQLDQLTQLIEKAVVTTQRLPEFHSPKDDASNGRWTRLKEFLKATPSAAMTRIVEKALPLNMRAVVEEQLLKCGRKECTSYVGNCESLSDARKIIDLAQSSTRQRSFPLLARIRPTRVVDAEVTSGLNLAAALTAIADLRTAESNSVIAKDAAKHVSEAQLAVAKAMNILQDAGLIASASNQAQICPVCEYNAPPTLTTARVEHVSGVIPAQQALSQTAKNETACRQKLAGTLEQVAQLRAQLLPPFPSEKEWTEALENSGKEVADAAVPLREFILKQAEPLGELDNAIDQLLEDVVGRCEVDGIAKGLESLPAALATLRDIADRYARLVKDIESAVGTGAQADPQYALREAWLQVANDVPGVVGALKWEKAKQDVQHSLSRAREKLIETRQSILEARRSGFNKALNEIWQLLRRDTYSAFSQLMIPAPSGRGFPIEIQVKAILDSSDGTQEVDALRVLSESQIHVIGIAAFITRAQLLGHHFLFFDDPVQSMDEDHFRTFAGPLLNWLLEQHFQVIVLTHNDTFARDVANAHARRDDYVSLKVELSPRSGCVVSEGSRRLSSRLKRVRKAIDNGDAVEGWRWIRMSVERLYLLVRIECGQTGFDPVTWRKHTAEAMWNESIGALVDAKDATFGAKLRDYLTLTAAGAHDVPARGVTDLQSALDTLRAVAGAFSIKD